MKKHLHETLKSALRIKFDADETTKEEMEHCAEIARIQGFNEVANEMDNDIYVTFLKV